MDKELVEKYGLVFEGLKRYYKEDLTERDYSLENCVPHRLIANDKTIETNKWGDMIKELSLYLFSTYPEKTKDVLSYKTGWSKQFIFAAEPRTNFKHVVAGVYVNVNQTALHSCWIIQDLLDLFEIDKGKAILLIRRSHDSEPKDVAEALREERIASFKLFLRDVKGKKESDCYLICKFVREKMEPLLRDGDKAKTYTDIFRFDDKLTFYNYVSKIRDTLKNDMTNPRDGAKAEKYFDYLNEFYKTL